MLIITAVVGGWTRILKHEDLEDDVKHNHKRTESREQSENNRTFGTTMRLFIIGGLMIAIAVQL